MPSYMHYFDLTNGLNVLRLICGLFFIPHLVAKMIMTGPLLDYLKNAKFNPPKVWLPAAGAIEAIVSFCLVFAIYTPYAAVIAAIHLAVASVAIYKVSKKWIWVIGGAEYCIFWSLVCVALAMMTWPR